jgi:hypothetical protein
MKRIFLAAALFLSFAYSGCATADVQNFKFGILKAMPNGNYEMGVETARIPMRYEKSGFRFGIAFDNPSADAIEWYEVVRLPKPLKKVTGDFVQSSEKALTSAAQKGRDAHVVDQFWFDEGDPLGPHSLELYVNGVVKYKVNFEVVKAE